MKSHRDRGRRRPLQVVALGILLAVIVVSNVIARLGTVEAQSDAVTLPMILTLERAQAFVEAARRNLDYLPGEVLVRFKTGVGPAGQQRALAAVRSRPSVAALRWVGEVAILRDSLEQDATILAAQLGEQPEVEYAEPNYVARINRTPTDPGFAARQWNFSMLDLSSAWDINDGASNIIVAVLDSGVTTINQSVAFRTW